MSIKPLLLLASLLTIGLQSSCNDMIIGGGYNFDSEGAAPTGSTASLALTRVDPSSWPNSGGVSLILEGAGFISASTTVTVAGVPAPRVSVLSSSVLVAELPAKPGTVGPVEVEVSKPGGETVARADLFAYSATTLGFSPVTVPSAPGGKQGLVAGDFNGDGWPDLAASLSASPELSVYLGAKDEAAARIKTVGTQGGPQNLVAADFNRDNMLDLVVAGTNGLELLPGDGAGGFKTAVSLPVLPPIGDLVVADFDQDGRPDIAALSGSGAVVLFHLTAYQFSAPYTIARDVRRLIAAGNGPATTPLHDICLARNDGQVTMYYGSSSRKFFAGPGVRSSGTVTALAVADVNGDSYLDLAVGNSVPEVIVVLTHNGSFGAEVRTTLPAAPHALLLRDFDGDRFPELIFTADGSGELSLHRGLGLGRFAPAQRLLDGLTATAVIGTDWDGDSLSDLVILSGDRTLALLNRAQ